ncbi:hypothetical protein PIB30_074142, partial [Stylosanthes scabra]|nr:hypothetical protein [Stylosanthes scabra]
MLPAENSAGNFENSPITIYWRQFYRRKKSAGKSSLTPKTAKTRENSACNSVGNRRIFCSERLLALVRPLALVRTHPSLIATWSPSFGTGAYAPKL